MSRNLTLKQKKFVGDYLTHGNATKAVRNAYPGIQTEGARRTMGSKLVANGNVRNEIQAVLDREGLTSDLVVRALKGLIEGKNDTEKNKALRTASEIMGLIGGKGVGISTQVNIDEKPRIVIDQKLVDDMKVVVERLRAMNKNDGIVYEAFEQAPVL